MIGARTIRRRGERLPFLKRRALPFFSFFFVSGLGLLLFAGCSRSAAPAQTVPPAPPLVYLGAWGTAGAGPGRLSDPRALNTDFIGNVFLADVTPEGKTFVNKFSPAGQPLLAFEALGIHNPQDVGVDSGEAIYLLADRGSRLQIYTPEGKRFRTLWIRRGRSGKGPASLAIDSDGHIYWIASGAQRVVKMNPRGRVLGSWGKPENMSVKSWAPSRLRVGPDGNLYVADVENQRIEKLAPDGQLIADWEFSFTRMAHDGSPQTNYGLAVSKDFVVASDEGKRLLGIWTLEGQPKLIVNFAEHPEWGKNAAPSDAAFTPKGELLVLDRPDLRVLRLRINLPESAASPAVP